MDWQLFGKIADIEGDPEAVRRLLDDANSLGNPMPTLETPMSRRRFLGGLVAAAGAGAVNLLSPSTANAGLFETWQNPDPQTLGLGWEDYVDPRVLTGEKLTPKGFDLSNYGRLTFLGNFDESVKFRINYDKSVAAREQSLDKIIKVFLPMVVAGLGDDPKTAARLMGNQGNLEGLKRELANIIVIEGKYKPGSPVYTLFEGVFLNSSKKPLVATVPFNHGDGVELGLITDGPLTQEQIVKIYGKELDPKQETRWHPVLGPPVLIEAGILKTYEGHNAAQRKGFAVDTGQYGFDYYIPVGVFICPIARGVIKDRTSSSLGGIVIWVNHVNGYLSVYSHLSEILDMQIGQIVNRDHKIAKSGKSHGPGEYLVKGGKMPPQLDLTVYKK